MAGPQGQIGTVVLSIDVPGATSESLARKLYRMVDARHLGASWAPQAPQEFCLRDELANSQRHDLALVGDDTWIGAGRTLFARELAARVESVRADQIQVSAIALRGVPLDDHLDLLVKHRIGMIRDQNCGNLPLQPRSVRFGVWSSPVSVVLPQPHDWSWFGMNRSARQIIRRAAAAKGVAHIAIDAGKIDGATTSEVDLLLAHLQRQRDRGLLQVTSLAGLTASLVRRPTRKKATSILRAG